MSREQLQFTETCHFPNLCKKTPFNSTDLAIGPGIKELTENPELQRHEKIVAES